MENTYWNKQGLYQAEYDDLINLMPASGNSDTVAGEMIRAVSRLAYDFYNNGMGNNTSGAVNFLDQKGVITREVYNTIYPHTTGAVYRGDYNGDRFQVAIEQAIDETVGMIICNTGLITEANTEDMFDFSNPDEPCYDDDEWDNEEEEYEEEDY